MEAGTQIRVGGQTFALDHTVLEGHRFAVEPVASGEHLLSWGLPFGLASRDIVPGNYVCNEQMLAELKVRNLDGDLPSEANFHDEYHPHRLEETLFRPGTQVEQIENERTFSGYRRGHGRGVGTRNHIVILGTTSRTASFARLLDARLSEKLSAAVGIDGIVSVSHTEAGRGGRPNNYELVLRTLAGFMVHPNVGAVLAIDDGSGSVTNQVLRQYMMENGYPLGDVVHRFLTLEPGFQSSLEAAEEIVRGWVRQVSAFLRTQEPLSELRVALQCGGSDAFSGVSANPLVGWVTREIIRRGGSSCLAETDELIGSESYILENIRDLDLAHRFLSMIQRFKERVAWHGHTAQGNPSGGNKLRGLYNIALKSIGAGMKKSSDVRVDYLIEYGERMASPGFYFMDSPGNDLESVAGEVASGFNLIFFTTGNGSITNFPFVPTVKFMTTTGRYQLVGTEMDVNAGAYLDGTSMSELGQNVLDLTIRVASGERTKGEKAGHYQVSIWRDWQQTDKSDLERLQKTPEPVTRPLPIKVDATKSGWTFEAIRQGGGYVTDQLGLILPTSLCSGQVACLLAERLNRKRLGQSLGLTRFVALPHTEGCGVSGGSSEVLYARTMLGYLTHPLARFALLLEHGCEKTHNDYMRLQLRKLGEDPDRFGWASVQMDGGIERAIGKAEEWFDENILAMAPPTREEVELKFLALGLAGWGTVPEDVAHGLAEVSRTVVSAGGTIIVPKAGGLLASPVYLRELTGSHSDDASLAYGQKVSDPGFYIMDTPTEHWVEILTGLGATAVELVLAHVEGPPLQGHAMIPLLQVTSGNEGQDFDLHLTGSPASWPNQILELVAAAASRRQAPKLFTLGNTDFQLARGLLGVSM